MNKSPKEDKMGIDFRTYQSSGGRLVREDDFNKIIDHEPDTRDIEFARALLYITWDEEQNKRPFNDEDVMMLAKINSIFSDGLPEKGKEYKPAYFRYSLKELGPFEGNNPYYFRTSSEMVKF